MANKTIVKKSDRLASGALGATSGTGFLGIIASMELDPTTEQTLILLAPWFSLIVALFLSWLTKTIKIAQVEWTLNRQLNKALIDRDRVLNDPNSTQQEKKSAKDRYAAIEEFKWQFRRNIVSAAAEDASVDEVPLASSSNSS